MSILEILVGIIGVLLIISLILSIIKKSMKLIIIVCVGCLIFCGLCTGKAVVRNKFNLEVQGKVIEYRIGDMEGSLDFNEVDIVNVTKGENGGKDLQFKLKNGFEYTINVPTIAWIEVKSKLKEVGANFVEY